MGTLTDRATPTARLAQGVPAHPRRATSTTVRSKSTKLSASGVRRQNGKRIPRAVLVEVGLVALPPEILDKLADLVVTTKRTSKVIEGMRELGYIVKDWQVRAIALSLSIDLERGPEPEGGGPQKRVPHPSERRPRMGRPEGIHTQYSKLRDRARELRDKEKLGAAEIAQRLGCARTYVYKLLSDD